MKLKQIAVTTLICLTIVWSCGSDDDSNSDNKAYYQFDDFDRSLILDYDYQVDQIISYRNQSGEYINFKVISNEAGKQGYYGYGTFFGSFSSLSNYYDNKIVRFEILENDMFAPEGLVNYVFSKNFDMMTIGINVPMWNISNFTFIDEIQNPTNIPMTEYINEPRIQMNINGHVFDRIVIIESMSDDVYSNTSYGTILQNVNKVYYDFGFGIVRFDDIDGNVWELVYPSNYIE